MLEVLKTSSVASIKMAIGMILKGLEATGGLFSNGGLLTIVP